MRYVRFVLSGLLITLFLLMTSATFAQDVIKVGDTVEGTRTDSDIEYSIALEAGQLVIITVVSTDFDSNVAVLDSAGTELAYDDDSAGNTNPYLAFFVPATGEYRIRVGAFFGQGSGAFTLTVVAGQVTAASVGSPLDIQFDGTPQFFSFEANAGDVVTVTAANENFLSIDIALTGPDGVLVSDNSAFFIGARPLRRVILPLSGLYSVKLSSYSVSDVASPVTFSVVSDTVLTLDNGPVTVVVEENVVDFDVVRFTATAGTTYILSVSTDNLEKGASVDFVLGVDEYGFDIRGEFSIRNAEAGSVQFTPTVDGVISFVVSEEGFFSLEERPTNITLSIAAK